MKGLLTAPTVASTKTGRRTAQRPIQLPSETASGETVKAKVVFSCGMTARSGVIDGRPRPEGNGPKLSITVATGLSFPRRAIRPPKERRLKGRLASTMRSVAVTVAVIATLADTQHHRPSKGVISLTFSIRGRCYVGHIPTVSIRHIPRV